jgi:predicted amidophosphoribosyltransferase
VSPRWRPLSDEEQETRRIAYAIKSSDASREIAAAAAAMAALLPPNLPSLTLVPLPASSGCKKANLALSRAISAAYSQAHGTQARVVEAIERTVPVKSSCLRRRRGLPGLRAADHQFMRVGGWLPMPVYLVDNVAATGATMEAAVRAIGAGVGLVWAEAIYRNVLLSQDVC